VPLVYVAAPELVLLGALGYLGVDFNLVRAVLPPLLFVIALATAVHLQVRFRDALEDGLRGTEAVRATYEDKGWAVLWTGVTTIVGFGSLAVSRVGPVPTLGLASAAGIALVTVAAFTLYPALLVAFGTPRRSLVGGSTRGPSRESRRPRAFEHHFRRLGRAWAEWAADRRRVVLAVALLAMALAAAGLPRLRVESNAVTFLPAEHPARAGIEELEAAGVGVAAAEVFLTLPEGSDEGLGSAARIAELGELTGEMRRIPRVLGAVGPGDLLAEALRRSRGAGAVGITPELALGFLRADPASGARLRAFVSDNGRAARITLFVPTDGHRELEPLFARAGELTREWARQAFPGARVSVTGEFPLLLSTHRRLLSTLGLSLTLTTLAVGVIFRFLLPSTRLTLLALLPNLWPVAMVVGTMAWAGIPLDTATVMVASVVLGLAVDDTIHTLGHFRELAPALGRREAVAGTLERTAPAYILTGAILAAGFGVCALSDFAPTARFGGLSALAIAFAVAGDLFLLPALLGSTPHSVVGRLERRG
jgi:predicted RND superfamily exporter protein